MSNKSIGQRLEDIQKFYQLLEQLENKAGGKRILANCNGRMNWPQRGVYFFFEPGEMRSTSGTGPRVVRVGTHGLKTGGTQTLWKRLSNHQGSMKTGSGNHRGSIFRKHVGSALLNQGGWPDEIAQTWGKDRDGSQDVRRKEETLEKAVSSYIRNMPFLLLNINDVPGPESLRGYIERNCIAMLSNYNDAVDPPSVNWLGCCSNHEFIRRSGLWNVKHVTEIYQRVFLTKLEELIS